MSTVLKDLYCTRKEIDHDQVSVHSAFICLLHIANEKGLNLDPDGEEIDLEITKAFRKFR